LPVKVSNGTGTGLATNVVQVTVGSDHACARISNGTARCWGYNPFGELGDGTTTNHSRPVKVSNGTGTASQTLITQIVAGYQSTCARIADGTARCWGRNGEGQLGDGTRTSRKRPVPVRSGSGTGPMHGVTAVTTNGFHSCARISDGTARCWGVRDALGDSANTPTPGYRLVPTRVLNSTGTGPLMHVVGISAGTGHTCVRETDRTARCFGENGEGEVGDGTTTTRNFPVVVG
jgi:alpha-tubulin suppressor-like RCC1 family protein